MFDALRRITDVVEGLIPLLERPPVSSLQSGYLAGEGGTPEHWGYPVHCLRSVSQRSLSTPKTWLSTLQSIAATTDVFAELVTDPANGALNGVGTGGTAPRVFNDNDNPTERALVDNLVCYAMRAKVSCMAQAGQGGPGTPFNYGRYVESIKDFVRDYCVVRVYDSSDLDSPWVDSTPLRYFDRPDGKFLPIPPVMWTDRDGRMELDVKVADFGAGAGSLPELSVTSNAIDAQLSILIETLWTPDPDRCGDFWPGSLCDRDRVKGWHGYAGK